MRVTWPVALALALLAGCASATPSPAPPSAPPSTRSDQAVALCQRYTAARGTLQRVVAELQAGPVLGPGLTFLLVAPRELAATPGIRDPQLAAAMAELTAALDDLGAQAEAKLPPGADPVRTAVHVDPARTVAAVAGVDRACAVR